jgi:hypothetical protein
MSYIVAIRRNADGEVRLCPQPFEWEEGSNFQWTEGNYGCDCNRELFFERAAGLDPDVMSATCGTDRYSVEHIELPDGTRIELEEL